MSFPIKPILTGSELLALYNEVGGNVAIRVSDIAALSSAGGNGMFSAVNFWDGSLDGSNVPTTGIWSPVLTPGGSFGISFGLFLNESWVVHGSADPAQGINWLPTVVPSIKFLGISEFTVNTSANSLFGNMTNFTVDGDAITATSTGDDGVAELIIRKGSFGEIDNFARLSYASRQVVEINNSGAFLGNRGSDSGNTGREGFFSIGAPGVPPQLKIRSKIGAYYLGEADGTDLPNQVDTASMLLGIDMIENTGRIVMRDAATLGFLPLAQADQVIPAAITRTISGSSDSQLYISGLFALNFSATTAHFAGTGLTAIGIAESQGRYSPASIRFNNNNGSYVYGNGFGANMPPLNTNIDTYLTIDTKGNLGRRTVLLESNPNYFNTNLPLTASRTHTGAGFALSMTGLLSLNYTATNSALTLDSSLVQLTHDGGAPDLGMYKLGDGSVNTRMPDDPGGNLFLKYDPVTGQIYKENTVLAADGNGMFDLNNNNGTWLVDTWNLAEESVATVVTSFTFKTPSLSVTVAPSGLLVSDEDILDSQIQIETATTAAKIDLGTGATISGFYIGTADSSHDQFEIQRKDGVVPIVRIVRTAPSLSLVINSSGEIGLSTYSGTPVAPGTEVRLLGVNSAGTMIPVDSAGYENPAIITPLTSYARSTGFTPLVGTTLPTKGFYSAIFTGSADNSGSGGIFTGGTTGITVPITDFIEVHGLMVFVSQGKLNTGSVDLIDPDGSILESVPYNSGSTAQEQHVIVNYTGSITTAGEISVVLRGDVSDVFDITHAQLIVRN